MRGPDYGANTPDIEDPAGADVVLFIISLSQVADHNAREGRVDKFIIAEINADMGDCAAPAKRMKEDQITLL